LGLRSSCCPGGGFGGGLGHSDVGLEYGPHLRCDVPSRSGLSVSLGLLSGRSSRALQGLRGCRCRLIPRVGFVLGQEVQDTLFVSAVRARAPAED
jgi:hypothetical protein